MRPGIRFRAAGTHCGPRFGAEKGAADVADSWGGRRRHVARIVAISATGRAELHTHGGHLLVGLGLVLALSAALFVPSSAGGVVPRFQEASRQSVIVLAAPGSVSEAESAVRRAGGVVRTKLGIVNGFSARVPASSLRNLRTEWSVVSITADTRLEPHGKPGRGNGGGGGDELPDMGTMYATTLLTGAREYWKAGYTGHGIGIALIDTGVAPIDGLTFAEKVVNGPDLSFESQDAETRYIDTNGHGTHLAGIIAGRADSARNGSYVTDTESFLGVAPDARIVSIKVANRVGAADVSQVIAAIDWVVQHKDDRHIRVLNLAYGADSRQPYEVDPLAFAAEQAWKHGLVVVTAAGNDGFSRSGSMTSPAYDPYVLAVGATSTNGTVALGDDEVASFSSSGKSRNPDLVAPGTSIVSLRVPGSYVDDEYSSTGYVSPTLFRGSGTSQAAAVVAGAAALILEQRPTITPDQVKKILKDTAFSLTGTRPDMQGNGTLNLVSALTFKTPRWTNTATSSTGTGQLEDARGSLHVTNGGVELVGEQDIFGKPFDSAAIAELEASASSWSGGWWNGSEWAGSSWSGSSWSGSSWSTSLWSSSSWSGSSWSSSSWSSSSWSSSSWSSSSWSSAYWR